MARPLIPRSFDFWFEKENSLAPALRAAAAAALAAEIARPIAPYADWRRPAPALDSSKPAISLLLRFMADPAAECLEIRRAQHERSQVESFVERNQLDLDLKTERKSNPHTLICRKNNQSYQRALKQRSADETLLERLR